MKTSMRRKFGNDETDGRLQAVFAGLLAKTTQIEPDQFYNSACEQLAALDIKSKDVMAFSRRLKSYRHHPNIAKAAGLYISAMMAKSAETQFVVSPAGMEKPLDYLGYRNTKEVVVIGTAGARLGYGMTGGSIFIDGDAGIEAGAHMTDGTIWVQGDAADRAGLFMQGGLIHIRGHAGKELGHGRQGGTILTGANAKPSPLPASAMIDTSRDTVARHTIRPDDPMHILAREPAKITVA